MDTGHEMTDEHLSELQKKIVKVYSISLKEVNDYFKEFGKKDKEMQEKLKAGKITEKDYKKWKRREIQKSKQYKQMRKSIAEKLTNADKIAADYINGDMPKIYTLNRNYAAFDIENSQVNLGTSFTLVDESTVKRLIETEPELLPNYPQKRVIDVVKNSNYYQKSVTKQVTTGILLGESNQKIAKRLMQDLPNLGKKNAIRAARTATTNAQNAGRLDTYIAAENMGTKIQKQWMATHDGRTRLDHILADGQIADVKKPFIVGGHELMYPGDKKGHPSEVYNCRCTQISVINGRQYYKPDTEANFKQWQKDKAEYEQKKRNAAKKKKSTTNNEKATEKSQSHQEEKLKKEVEKEQNSVKSEINKITKSKSKRNAQRNTNSGILSNAKNSIRDMLIDFTNGEVDSMSRKQLESVAKAVFIQNNTDMSEYEALQRCTALIDGNTNSQLKKYIKKYMR